MSKPLVDSIGTSLLIGLFPDEEAATRAHVLQTVEATLPITMFKACKVDNLNPARLSENPYPVENRPRGKADLASVAHHRRTIRSKGRVTSPVWLAKKDGKYIMLDGVHRVVATYLEKKRTIPAYVVRLTRRRARRV